MTERDRLRRVLAVLEAHSLPHIQPVDVDNTDYDAILETHKAHAAAGFALLRDMVAAPYTQGGTS